jgi:hypothetical protein
MGILNPEELEKRPRGGSILAGSFISLAVFALILTVMAWLIPRFLHFTYSPWAKLIPLASLLFIGLGGYLRRRRT